MFAYRAPVSGMGAAQENLGSGPGGNWSFLWHFSIPVSMWKRGGGQAWGRAAYLFDAFQRRMNVYMWFRVGVEGLRQILLCSWFSHPSCSTVFSLSPVQYLLVVIAEEMERYCVGE